MRKILLVGGGTGGHIYPLLAVADEIKKADPSVVLFYLGPKSQFNECFSERGIRIYTLLASKFRRYFDFENILDIPKFFISLFQALWYTFHIMPDAVFSKGGPGALAAVLAARVYFIPVMIHESDAVPGFTNRCSAYFAKRIAISFRGAAAFFPVAKTVFTGNPVRGELLHDTRISEEAGKQQLGFNSRDPLLLVLGGSQGSARLNSFVVENLEQLLSATQIFHQTGTQSGEEISLFAETVLKNTPSSLRERYKSVGYLNAEQLKTAFAAADVVLSRAGASAIYEIAAFGKPSLLVPLDESAQDHQRKNAYEYAKTGAAIVIEENNLKPNVVLIQLKNILGDEARKKFMGTMAIQFFKSEAARSIAEEVLRLA